LLNAMIPFPTPPTEGLRVSKGVSPPVVEFSPNARM
jgi:hypothetical protein